LELYSFTFQLDGSDFLTWLSIIIQKCLAQTNNTYEIDTNSRDVALGVGIVSKTEQKTRLSNSRIANKQKLKQIITISHVDTFSQHSICLLFACYLLLGVHFSVVGCCFFWLRIQDEGKGRIK